MTGISIPCELCYWHFSDFKEKIQSRSHKFVGFMGHKCIWISKHDVITATWLMRKVTLWSLERMQCRWIIHLLTCVDWVSETQPGSPAELRSRDHCPLLEDHICFSRRPFTLERTLKMITRKSNRKMQLELPSQKRSHSVGVGVGGGSPTIQFIGLWSNKPGNESTMTTNINKQSFLFTYRADQGRLDPGNHSTNMLTEPSIYRLLGLMAHVKTELKGKWCQITATFLR